ncbi:MAG: glutathione peroxidase [Paenibacillaceae bacterium]|nr:glutathione peroxidase [Paenibacillaceae bacterium]
MMVYDVPIQTIDGQQTTLAAYAGNVLLIVNTASKCGFTPQYEGLQRLYDTYRAQGFFVLGFPCNQFGAQEPGTEEEIAAFCSTHYNVTFPMFAKIDVNGQHTHPLYGALKQAAPGLLGSQAIKWNFTKFLIDRSGTQVKRYAPTHSPADLEQDIQALLS